MSWTIRCCNPRCNHVCNEDEWVERPKKNPTPNEVALGVTQSHCPRCDCTTYRRATEADIARAAEAKKARMDAAAAATC